MPFVPLFTCDNGGATSRGATDRSIVIAVYVGQADPSTQAALAAAGVSETPEEVKRIDRVNNRYFQLHYETYGREYVMVHVDASAPVQDEGGQRADAIRIAEEIGAFVCFSCPRFAAEELAARGVITILGLETHRLVIERTRPFLFGERPPMDEHYDDIAEYWGKRLQKKPARYAGDPLLQAQERKFGLVWLDGLYGQVDEGFGLARDYFLAELNKYSLGLAAEASYNLDYSRAGEQAVNIIVKMKNAGVTTLTMVGDPLYPVFLTYEATRQGYRPEWFISGSVLIDTTFFGRTYDQTQWSQAFGISPLWVFWNDKAVSEGYREYHHVCQSAEPEDRRCEASDEGVGINTYRDPWAIFSIGVHLAGPNLTPETFAQGMYSFPRSGGVPHIPLSYFTPDRPMLTKDHTEVFWEAQARGKDETDRDGLGMLFKTNGGARYEDGQWPNDEPTLDRSTAISSNDELYTADVVNHDRDGHAHPYEQICRSCRHGRGPGSP